MSNDGARSGVYLARAVIAAVCAAALVSTCANLNNEGAAVPKMTGVLVDTAGAPVAGVNVSAFDIDHEPWFSDTGSLSTKRAYATDITGANGEYELILALGGVSTIVGKAPDGRAVFIDAVAVNGNTTVRVPTDTLRAPGALRGATFLAGQPPDSQSHVKVYAAGTNLFTRTETSGAFLLSQMPQGTYRLILAPWVVGQLGAMRRVSVGAGDTTFLDTVLLYGADIDGVPVVDAGRDTLVRPGGLVRLHATASDSFGQIVAYEWDFGGKGVFHRVSSGDTVIAADSLPDSTSVCIFRVTDNDSNRIVDTVRVSVAPVSFAVLGAMCIERESVGGWKPTMNRCSEYDANSLPSVMGLSPADSANAYSIRGLSRFFHQAFAWADTLTPDSLAPGAGVFVMDFIVPDSASSIYAYMKDSVLADTMSSYMFVDSRSDSVAFVEGPRQGAQDTTHILRAHLDKFYFKLTFSGLADTVKVKSDAWEFLQLYEERLVQ